MNAAKKSRATIEDQVVRGNLFRLGTILLSMPPSCVRFTAR